jgi:hypothetical protein
MTKRCKKCGSYAFNLHYDGIEQADFCDGHYWQDRAENPPRNPIAQSIYDAGIKDTVQRLPECEWLMCKALLQWHEIIHINSIEARIFCLIVAEALS